MGLSLNPRTGCGALVAIAFLFVLLSTFNVDTTTSEWLFRDEDDHTDPQQLAVSAYISDDATTFRNNVPFPVAANNSCVDIVNVRDSVRAPGSSQGQPVQYIHIPKTAGTTIQMVLKTWTHRFCRDFYLHNGDHLINWKCPEAKVSSGILVGHRGFGFCAAAQKRDPVYIAIFRDPVQRFVSLFDYIMVTDIQEFKMYHKLWKGRTLDEIVQSYHALLRDHPNHDAPNQAIVDEFVAFAHQQTSFMCGYDCVSRPINSEFVARAMRNLHRTHIVAVTEDLRGILAQLRMFMDWIPSDYESFRQLNKRYRPHSALSNESIAIVKEWSTYDQQLYEAARRLAKEKTDYAKACLTGS